MVRDVDDLVGKKARVDGVDHRAAAGHGVVDLEVPEAVPAERADAVGRLHAQALQRVGEPLRPLVRFAVGIAMHGAFDRLRDDLGGAMVAVGMADELADQKRPLHHQAKHDDFLLAR